MNQYTFELIAQHRPEVLERILRVIRLRGSTVTNMEMALVDTQVRLKITVKSDRTFDLLVNQSADRIPASFYFEFYGRNRRVGDIAHQLIIVHAQ